MNNGTCGWATLTLPNVTRNHTGRYICQVSINKPTLIVFRGNGTMITVRERRSPTNGTTQESTFLYLKDWFCLSSKPKVHFVVLDYQSLAVYSNIRQDRLGVWVAQLPAERY